MTAPSQQAQPGSEAPAAPTGIPTTAPASRQVPRFLQDHSSTAAQQGQLATTFAPAPPPPTQAASRAIPDKSHWINCVACDCRFPPSGRNNGVHCTKCCNAVRTRDPSVNLVEYGLEAMARKASAPTPPAYRPFLQLSVGGFPHRRTDTLSAPSSVGSPPAMAPGSSVGAQTYGAPRSGLSANDAIVIGEGGHAAQHPNLQGTPQADWAAPAGFLPLGYAPVAPRSSPSYGNESILAEMFRREIDRMDAVAEWAARRKRSYAPVGYEAVVRGGYGS